MTPQPNGQSRGSAIPGATMRVPAGVAQGGGQRPRTDPWPGQPAQAGARQQPVPTSHAPQQPYGQQQPHGQQAQGMQRPPQRPTQQQQPQRPPQPSANRAGAGRRWLGVLAFLVLTGLSLPIHVLALFFAFVEFASPGDATTAALLVVGAFVGSFVALLVTATVSQLIGGFASRWRVRITFAVANAVIALGVALIASLTLF